MGVQENVGMVSSCARYFICHAEIRWMKQVQDIDDLLLIEITGLRIVNGQRLLSGLHIIFEIRHHVLLSATATSLPRGKY